MIGPGFDSPHLHHKKTVRNTGRFSFFSDSSCFETVLSKKLFFCFQNSFHSLFGSEENNTPNNIVRSCFLLGQLNLAFDRNDEELRQKRCFCGAAQKPKYFRKNINKIFYHKPHLLRPNQQGTCLFYYILNKSDINNDSLMFSKKTDVPRITKRPYCFILRHVRFTDSEQKTACCPRCMNSLSLIAFAPFADIRQAMQNKRPLPKATVFLCCCYLSVYLSSSDVFSSALAAISAS